MFPLVHFNLHYIIFLKLKLLANVPVVALDGTSQKGHCCGNYDAGLTGSNVFKSQLELWHHKNNVYFYNKFIRSPKEL